MDWSSIVSGAASVGLSGVFGGVVGLLGTGLQAYSAYKTKQVENERLKINRDYDIKELALEGENAARLQTIREDGASERSADSVRVESYRHDKTLTAGLKPPSGWVGKLAYGFFALCDGLNRLIRPAATIVLTYAAIMLTWEIYKLYAAIVGAAAARAVSNEDALWVLLMRAVDMVMFLWCMSMTWWFGGRALKPSEIQQMGKR